MRKHEPVHPGPASQPAANPPQRMCCNAAIRWRWFERYARECSIHYLGPNAWKLEFPGGPHGAPWTFRGQTIESVVEQCRSALYDTFGEGENGVGPLSVAEG